MLAALEFVYRKEGKMETILVNFVSKVGCESRVVLDRDGALTQINELWYGVHNFDVLITQEGLNEVASFYGLTYQQLADAIAGLVAVRAAIHAALPSLTLLANLP
jgi:hypothetical protein